VLITSLSAGEQSIVISVSLFFCLSVCPLAYLKNHMSKFHHIFCKCYLWQWLIPAMMTVQYVMQF